MVFDEDHYRDTAKHGLAFLQQHHRQDDGGYAWVLNGHNIEDGTRHCYGHAFVLLAVSAAANAGVDDAAPLIDEVYALLEDRFWEADQQLYVDVIHEGDWAKIDSYRGQNANMHMCEAMLVAFEATSDIKYLDRAYQLAKTICVDLASKTGGLIWEHYRSDWSVDWDYNRDDQRSVSTLWLPPGHFVEWAKLLIICTGIGPSAG